GFAVTWAQQAWPRITGISRKWMHVKMHVKIQAPNGVTERRPVEAGVPVHDVPARIVRYSFQHVLASAAPPAQRNESVASRVERAGSDAGRFRVPRERLVVAGARVVRMLGAGRHVGDDEV